MNDCSSIPQCPVTNCAGNKDYDMESLIWESDCETMHGTPTPTTGASIDHTKSTQLHQKTNQRPSITWSRSLGKTPERTPESTGRRRDRKGQLSSSSLTIVVSAFGSLIVLILAVMLVLLIICIFQKRRHQQCHKKRTLNMNNTTYFYYTNRK